MITLAAMTDADLDAVLEVDHDAFGARAPRRAQLIEELARPWSILRTAKEDGAVLGYLLAWQVVDELHLLDVAVRSAARRRGIGRALMDDLLAIGRAKACTRVLLEVRVSNAPAVALYEALGFVTDDVRKRYYDDGEDARTMSLGL